MRSHVPMIHTPPSSRRTLLPLLLLLLLLPIPPLAAQEGRADTSRPTLHVLAIGVDEYEGVRLSAAVSDTRAFSEMVQNRVSEAGTFDAVEVVQLLNQEATRSNLNAFIREFVDRASPADVFVFFFAGMGLSGIESDTTRPVLVLPDAAREDITGPVLKSTSAEAAVPPELLRTWLDVIPARNLLVVIDAPFGAGFVDAIRELDAERRNVGTNLTLMALDGISVEVPLPDGGTVGELTLTLLRGLEGAGNEGRTAHELADHFLLSHAEISESRAQPFVFSRGSDFPLTRVPGPTAAGVAPDSTSDGGGSGVTVRQATVVEGRVPVPISEDSERAEEAYQPPLFRVEVEGKEVPVEADGRFTAMIHSEELKDGEIRVLARRIEVVPMNVGRSPWNAHDSVVVWRSERILPVPVLRGLEGGGLAASAEPVPRSGRDIALLFATNEYERLQNLRNPIFDAEAIARELESVYGFEVHFLRNPTDVEIQDTLVHYATRANGGDDRLLLFFAGHGEYDRTHIQDGVLAARNTLPASEDRYRNSTIQFNFIRRVLERATAKQVLVLLDVCYGGSFDSRIGEATHRSDDDVYGTVSPLVYLRRKMDLTTRRYVTSGGVERVPDGLPGQHSPFARGILEALRDWGGEDRLLTLAELLTRVQMLESEPRAGSFGGDEPGSDFVLVANPEAAEQVGGAPGGRF